MLETELQQGQGSAATALAAITDELVTRPESQRDLWGRKCRRLGEENSWDAMAEKFYVFLRPMEWKASVVLPGFELPPDSVCVAQRAR